MNEQAVDLKDVFKTKVKEQLALRPNQWPGDSSVAVVAAIVTSIPDGDGNPIVLSEEEDDVIQIASKPTVDTLVKVISTIVQKHRGAWTPSTEKMIRRVVSAPAFKLELTKAGIIKDTSAGGLKDLLS